MSKPTINKQPIEIGDVLYMVTSGLEVQVVDVSATRFVIRLPNGRVQNYPTEPVISRESGRPLFYWQDISKVETRKGVDIVREFNLFTALAEQLKKGA